MAESLVVAKAKREERKKIVDQMGTLVPKEAGITMSPENATKWAELDTKQAALKTEIEAIERQDTLETEMKNRRDRRASQTGKTADEIAENDATHKAAFGNYLRRGMNGLSAEDRTVIGGLHSDFSDRDMMQIQNALSGVDLSQGGVLIPEGFADTIVSAEKAYGGMIDDGVCYQFTTATGNELPIPTDNDTTNAGEYLGENLETAEGDVAFGAVRMQAYILSSKIVKVPFALLQDSAFDLEGFLANKFGERLGRGANAKFTNGTGSSQPKGVVTAATVGQTGASGQTTSIGYTDLISLKHSVDPAYRSRGPKWMFHDTTLKAVKLLVDGQGRPLWQSGIATKSPDTIDGDAFVINQDMPVMAANAKSVAYGDFTKYWIRRVKQMVLLQLRERYAEKFQVGFIAFERNDGNLIDAGTHPIKLYQNAGS